MKRFLAFSFSMMLALAVALPGTFALGEKNYVSIKEIRESLPGRWTGDYIINKGDGINMKAGDMVSVDVPIVVPEVDRIPVVRITWEPPVEGVDESVEVSVNDWGIKTLGREFPKDEMSFPLLENHITFDPALPWEDAPAIAIEQLRKWLPFMKDKELAFSNQCSYGISEDNGFQCVYFYTSYHGIPHLFGGDYYVRHVKSEYIPKLKEKGGLPGVPLNKVAVRIKRPDQFWANLNISKEVGVDLEDIPLLPFEEILKVFEQRVTDGYAYSLNEVRFGYMCFIDPDKKREEFVLVPIWAAGGRTRGDLKLSFDLKTDQAMLDRWGYNCDSIVINAQTGQVYDFYNDKRPDRRHVPHIITWDEVK